MLLGLVALAAAHPASSGGGVSTPRSTVGQRMELVITASAADLRYIAEVPERRALEEARALGSAGYGERLLATLASNVRLTWDGQPLPATPVPLTDAAKGGEPGFLDFSVAWHAELPASSGTLGVRNGNFPDEPSFFATSMVLSGDLVAEETSLLHVKDGRLRDNWHGAWVRDESAREPWVRIRPAGWGEGAAAPEPLPKRMAGLHEPTLPPWALALLALSLVPIGLLGRWLGRRARSRR